MRGHAGGLVLGVWLFLGGCGNTPADLEACVRTLWAGFRPVAEDRAQRFLGKVEEDRARCRGGARAVELRRGPWVDWPQYWATGDSGSRMSAAGGGLRFLRPDRRGIDGALVDLEYQRIELIRFNLFDNSGTYPDYVGAAAARGARAPGLARDAAASGPPELWRRRRRGEQRCRGELIRHRTLTGICNDIRNPLMGSTGMPFARNVEFEATFPELGPDELARNRHGGRIGLLRPDPQVISRRLLGRRDASTDTLHAGMDCPAIRPRPCDYRKAPFLNVLAAFWIQFMTHDWFSHLDEGRNGPGHGDGIAHAPGRRRRTALSRADTVRLGCRAGDRVDAAASPSSDPPRSPWRAEAASPAPTGRRRNTVTAWWDASQLYGYDERPAARVKRDPGPGKLRLLSRRRRPRETAGYLPVLEAGDPIHPRGRTGGDGVPGQLERRAELFHNVFAREHNLFVDAFRKQAAAPPDADSGLRDPGAARSGPPLPRGGRPTSCSRWPGSWSRRRSRRSTRSSGRPSSSTTSPSPGARARTGRALADEARPGRAREVLRAPRGPGTREGDGLVLGLRLGPGHLRARQPRYADGPAARPQADLWSLAKTITSTAGRTTSARRSTFPRSSSPCTDCIPWCRISSSTGRGRGSRRSSGSDPGRGHLPRPGDGGMRERGLANWALSLGRQRVGRLTLQNHPRFLQDLALPHVGSPTAGSTWPRSTSSGTASGACRASTSSAGSTASGS